MPGNFAFLRGKFPELADDGEKAEKYLYADNEVCMFFISRIFDNIVKILCSINGVKTNSDHMAGPLSELFKNKAIDEGVYLVLEMMRTFRNGNAHNKDYSLNESLILLQLSHIVCEWLMETHGGTNYRRKGYAVPAREIPAPKANPPATVPKPATPKPAPMSDKEFVALCAKGTVSQVQAALKKGANPKAKSTKGRTALMMAACSNPHVEVVDILIEAGADVKAKNNRGKTALDYAVQNKKLQGTETLKRLEGKAKTKS